MECLEIAEIIDEYGWLAEVTMEVFSGSTGFIIIATMKLIAVILDLVSWGQADDNVAACEGLGFSTDAVEYEENNCGTVYIYTVAVMAIVFQRFGAIFFQLGYCYCRKDSPGDSFGETTQLAIIAFKNYILRLLCVNKRGTRREKHQSTKENTFCGAQWNLLDILSKNYTDALYNDKLWRERRTAILDIKKAQLKGEDIPPKSIEILIASGTNNLSKTDIAQSKMKEKEKNGKGNETTPKPVDKQESIKIMGSGPGCGPKLQVVTSASEASGDATGPNEENTENKENTESSLENKESRIDIEDFISSDGFSEAYLLTDNEFGGNKSTGCFSFFVVFMIDVALWYYIANGTLQELRGRSSEYGSNLTLSDVFPYFWVIFSGYFGHLQSYAVLTKTCFFKRKDKYDYLDNEEFGAGKKEHSNRTSYYDMTLKGRRKHSIIVETVNPEKGSDGKLQAATGTDRVHVSLADKTQENKEIKKLRQENKDTDDTNRKKTPQTVQGAAGEIALKAATDFRDGKGSNTIPFLCCWCILAGQEGGVMLGALIEILAAIG